MQFNQLRRFITIAVIASVAALFISTYGEASPPDMGRFGKPGEGHHSPLCAIWQDPEMVERLDLTSEQVKGLKDADFAFRKTHFELKAQCDLLHLELEKVFSEDTADEASIQKVAQKLANVKSKIFLQFILFRLNTDKILTPKQRSKLRFFECWGKPPAGPHPKRPNNPYPEHM